MSTRYNFFGGLVTDSLILNLDAAKLQSYPGTGTTWRDISGNNNNGTLTNGPTLTGSGKNLAIRFDGTNDYVSTNLQTIERPCTFSTWVNLSVITGWQSFFGQDTSTVIPRGRFYFQKANFDSQGVIANKANFQIVLTDDSIVPVNANNVMLINTWYNYTVVLTNSDISLYENGVLQNRVNNSNTFLPANTPILLNAAYYNNAIVDFVNGKTSSFLIYNKPLSPFEVYQNFNALKGRYDIPDIVTSGLTLNLDAGNPYSYNPLNTGSTTWTDISGNGNNGTLTNGASYTGGTIFLDGTDDYVNCGTGSTLTFNNGTNLNDIPFTIGVWVKFNSVSGYQLVIAKSDYGSSPNKREFLFFTNADSKIHINLMNSDNYNNRIGRYYNTVLSTNTWYHMFATYNGSKLESGLKIYINGVRVDDTSDSLGTYSGLSRTTTPFSFGTDWNNYPNQGNKLSGYYGLGQVYRRELSAGEIAQNFNATRGRYGI
jgi:hypothetical protein